MSFKRKRLCHCLLTGNYPIYSLILDDPDTPLNKTSPQSTIWLEILSEHFFGGFVKNEVKLISTDFNLPVWRMEVKLIIIHKITPCLHTGLLCLWAMHPLMDTKGESSSSRRTMSSFTCNYSPTHCQLEHASMSHSRMFVKLVPSRIVTVLTLYADRF